MKNITMIFVFIVIIAIAVFDFWVIVKGGTEASISHLFIVWSYKYPAFTFLMGFTMGHLFWKIRDTKETSKLGK